ncbi:MAG: agmatinase [Bacteroidetes bacterium]|nr:MAG: agmatinase [Bacteroidota bacterium]
MITKTFGGIPQNFADQEASKIYLTSIPYDGTSTWGKGADKGFEAFLEAAENMELFDIETDSEVYRQGIHICDHILEDSRPEAVFEATYNLTKRLLDTGRFLTFFGGEHSVSIGIIKAFYEKYSNLTVLQLDAHADLRPEYEGTPYNHACALYDASRHTNLIQVGIRSMDITEKKFLNPDKCYFAHDIVLKDQWMEQAIGQMTEDVYITFDLDVFDSSLMPSTGTPEPGGLFWNETLSFLKKVFREKNVVGFDIVELAPNPLNRAPDYLTAKLYYKMLSYKFK